MKSTMQYSVGDEVAHVPSNEADEFNAVAKEQNITPEPIFTYRVSNKDGDVQQLDIPKAEYEEFAKTAGDNGYKIEPLRMMTMDDGSERYFSARELRAFMRSDEYLNSTDGAEAKARDEEMRRRIAEEEANRPGFWSELGRRMFTADGVRETAEESAWARPYAYANDLCNALVGGLLKGSAKISEGFGHLVGSESIVEAARNDQSAVDRALPTDMLETNEPGAVNKVLQVGKNVAGVTGEFAPSLIPGVGQAYAASLVGAGSTIRYMQVYDDAIAHGCDPDKATALASMGATVDAAQNLLLMGKFKGVWKGEQAALAEATKKSLVRRLTEDTLKVGATMAGGAAAGDVIDQAAEGAYWLDVKRTGKAGFDGFIEGGLFHLVNTGVHNAGKIGWHSEAKGIPAGAARDMMEAPEGRALIFANSPDAARAIFHARRRGEDVSRKMIEDLGLSGDVARTAADRNALGDRLMADYDAFKERVRTKMDDVQAAALADEIASRSEEGVNNPGFEKVWFKAVEQIKDATELDDPARRKEIVDAAVKVTETPAERRQREQAVEDAIKARQAEDAASKEPLVEKPQDYPVGTVVERADGKRFVRKDVRGNYNWEAVDGATDKEAGQVVMDQAMNGGHKVVSQPEATAEPVKAPEKPVLTPPEAPKAPVGEIKSPEAPKSVENPAHAKPVEAGPNKEAPVAPSAPTPVSVRPTTSAPAEAPKNEVRPENQRIDIGDPAGVSKSVNESMIPAVKNLKPGGNGIGFSVGDRQITVHLDNKGTYHIEVVHPGGEKVVGESLVADTALEYGLERAVNQATKSVNEVKFDHVITGIENRIGELNKELMGAKNGKGERSVEQINDELDICRQFLSDAKSNRDRYLNGKGIKEMPWDRWARWMSGDETAKPEAKKPVEAPKPAAEPPKAEAPKPDEKTNPGDIPVGERTFEPFDKKVDDLPIGAVVEDVDGKRYTHTKKGVWQSPNGVWHLSGSAFKDGYAIVNKGDSVPKTEASVPKTAPDVPKTAPVVPKTEEPVKTDDAKKPPLVSEKPVEKPVPAKDVQKNGTSDRTLSDVARELHAAGDLANPEERDAKVAKLQAEMEAMRTPGTPHQPFTGKPNPAKAAKIVSEFVYKPGKDDKNKRDNLAKVNHDKKNGVAVACDGRILIATKHGFDPNGEDNPMYPNWTRIVQKEKDTPISVTVNPTALAKTCKDILRLARATGVKTDNQYSEPKIALRFGDNVNLFSAEYMMKLAKAMEANGITELKTADAARHPAVARNADTTIVVMPFRGVDKDYTTIGRGDGTFIANGHNGRIISAPGRTDTSIQGPEYLKTIKDSYAKNRAESIERAHGMEFYKRIVEAQKKGVTDPAEVYDQLQRDMKNDKFFDSLNDENKATFTDWMKTTDNEELAGKVADYLSRNERWFIDGPKDIAKIEKRIAAEDEIEGLILRSQEARDFLGIKPEKPQSAEKTSEYDVEQEVKRVVGLIGKAENAAQLKEYADSFKFKDLDMVDGIKIDHDRISEALNKRSDELFGEKKPEEKKSKDFVVKFPRHIAAETDDPKEMLKALDDAEKTMKDAGPIDEDFERKVKATPKAAGGGGKMPAHVDTINPVEAYHRTVEAVVKNRNADEEVLKRVIGQGNQVSVLDAIEKQLEWGGYKNVSAERVRELLDAPFKDKAKAKTEKKTAYTELDKYLATKKPFEAGRILKTLGKKIDFGGDLGVLTEEQLIDRAAENGKSVVSAITSTSKKGKPSVVFTLDGNVITATAANYARARGVKIDENALARAAERAKLITMFGEDKLYTTGNTDSDADIERRIVDMSGKVKTLGNMRMDDGITYAERLDALKQIKNARVKRGDWNPEPAKTEPVNHERLKVEDAQRRFDSAKTAGEKSVAESEIEKAIDERDAATIAEIEKRNSDPKIRAQFIDKKTGAESEKVVDFVRSIESGDENGIFAGKGKHYRLAKTSDVLKECGLTGDYFTIRGGVILRHKGKDSEHSISANEWVDISVALNEKKPRLVEKYGTDENSYRIWTEATIGGKTAIVGVDVKSVGKDMEVNSIATDFGASGAVPKIENVIYPKTKKEIQSFITRHNSGRSTEPPSTEGSVSKSDAEVKAPTPGKFTDDVYEMYRSAPTYREGAKAFAEDTLEVVRDRIELEIRKAENAMEDARGENGTYKNEEMFDENASRVEVLNGQLRELKRIEERIKYGFEDDGETKSEIHEGLRDILSEMNAISPIEGFEDIGRFKPRRGAERTGVKEIDDFNDKWDDEGVSKAKPSDLTFGAVGEAETEIERKVQEYFGQEIAFDKEVYDQLSDGDKRYFGKLMKELDDAKDDVCYKDSKMSDAVRYVEAHEAVEQFAESARKMGELMRDKDGRPVLFTDKGRATEMATDGVKRAVKAFLSRNPSEANAATEMINLAIENGGDFPTKKQVAEMAKELPEELRDTFVRNADALRKYANGLKDEPSVADKATEIAGDVDAAIDAEERGGASGRPEGAPVMAPRGAGTGTLSQAEPMPQGTTITGKTSGIVTPQSFLKEARKLFPDIAIRAKGTVRMPKWAAGHFEPAYRIIRSRDMNAIRTITHELGHDLEYLTRYDLPRNPAAKRDLSDLGHALYPSGPGMPKPNSYIGEGFAEYIRGYICNADNLATVAPDMDAWFRGDFKAKHPEIVKKVNRLRYMVQTMKEQSACDTLRGFRHPATTVVERAWKKVTEFASSENWNDAASTILKGMKKSGIDKLYHWQDEFRELEEAVKAGDAVKAQRLAASVSDKVANHPYLFPTITRGTASQRVMDMARHGTTSLLGNQRTGESLKEIFADFSHKEQEAWKDYAIARHGIENYYAKGLEFGMPKEVLEEVVRQYDSPKFQQALQRVTDYSHRILHLGVDAGLISQETYDSIVANHPIYIRVTRRKADDMAGTKQGGAAISKRTGGFENILDPIDAMLMDQEKYLRACFQARSMQLIVQAAQRAKAANIKSVRDNGGPNTSTVNPRNQSHIAVGAYWPVEVPNAQEKVTFGAGKLKQGLTDAVADYAGRTGEDPIPLQQFVDDLATYTDPMGRMTQLSIFRDKPSQGKHNQVSVYVDGKLHTYELPDMKWANMLTDVYDKSEFNPIERAFGIATAGIRLGATTINPGFAIRNGIRDSLHSAVMSESGALPMLGTLNGMLNQLTGKEAAQMFRSMGGHMSDLVGVTKEQKWHHGGQVALAQNPLQSLQAYGAIDWALMKPVIKVTSDILSIPELGPRVREFNGIMQKCRAAGLNEDVCAMLAMSHAKDISIDFQRAGRLMKHINHYIPFSNAMWRGTEQTFRNLGVLPALPHQFEDRGMERGAKTVGKGLAYVTSWMATLAMLEMAGDDEDRRRAFEREPVEKWEYAHVGDWRIPLPFELGYLFGAIPKAAIYEMYGDKGAMKECLTAFNQAMPSKYLNPSTAVGAISIFTPIIGFLKNEDYRGRAIVPEHIMENRVKEDWYTQYTTELSKRIGKIVGASPAQLEYLLDSYTGGLYRRTALAVENIGDTSRLQEGRGFSMLDTLRARPQANRLVSDFYKFGEEAKQKLGSGVLSLEDYGKFASMNGVKEELTERFNAMRAIRADKSIPLAEQDKQVQKIADDVNETIRDFNARDDYRQRGIAYAASHLTGSTLESLDENTREQYTALLTGVPKSEIVQALIRFGNETVMVKQKGVPTPHRRWSSKNINERVGRLLMLMQGRD